ncbi:MAG: cell envelope integrity protein TolA [Gammaproteobacteria bacterium]|nr:cell envelope integrity protein TolA [Gammaproteobacteria bacterium]
MAKKRQDGLLLPFFKAGFIHLLMFGLLLISFQSSTIEEPLEIQVKAAPVIKATAISSAEVEKLVKQKKQRKDAAAKAERDRKRRIKQAADRKKKAARDKKRKKVAADKKRKDDAEKKRKKEAEDKKRKDAEEKKRREIAEKKRREIAEKKRREEAERIRLQQKKEREIQAQIVAEQNAAKQQQILTEVQKYVALIKNKISRSWIVGNQTGQCVLEVKLAAGGYVVDVREISGSQGICRSAQAAVYKADPLPVSPKQDVFNKMRTLRLTLDPQDM